MCTNSSLLLKFNSNEKQFTRLFISVSASDCILSPTNGGRPLWRWVGLVTLCVQGSEWSSSSRVILCQWYSAIYPRVTHMLLGLSTLSHHFQVI